MPNETPSKRSRRRQGISREQAISPVTTATSLYVADHDLFQEFLKRKKTTPAKLLRQIVHDWAVSIRVSGQAKDTMEMATPIRKLHEKILAEQLGPINQTLIRVADLLGGENRHPASATADTSSQPNAPMLSIMERLAEDLNTTKQELAKLRAFAVAHYMLSSQNFGATWAILALFQRYISLPSLKNSPAYKDKPLETALMHRDDARKEGLQMAQKVALEFEYPEQFELILLLPPDAPTDAP